MKVSYKHTEIACYSSYVVQGVINNLSPLLFVIFSEKLGLSFAQLSLLITVNFSVQIFMDLISALVIKKFGYRKCILTAHIFSALGLISIPLLTGIIPSKFFALAISTVMMSVGGGILEVMVSPIMEAIPKGEKAASMSLLHSFYCWGQVGVIAISTLYFTVFGTDNWRLLPVIWSVIPIFALILFTFVPINTLEGDKKHSNRFLSLAKNKCFWLMLIIMLCAGASELAIAQWASLFCEIGLGVNKTMGDLLGPCAFAVFMGLGRLFFGRIKPTSIDKWICISFSVCTLSYLIAVFAPYPLLSLLGIGLCGLSVAILWPGTYSLGSERMPEGGSLMFALFALMGDVGCVIGPDIIGIVSDRIKSNGSISSFSFLGGSPEEIGMKLGILIATAIPLIGLILSFVLFKSSSEGAKSKCKNDCIT